MRKLKKLKPGDKVAILSPSFAAPAHWPPVYALGLSRLQTLFNLEPVEYPTTANQTATPIEKADDLAAAFADDDIKGVITTIGGDLQVTYVKNMDRTPFRNHPKPFFGYSDNSHIANFLFLNDIPSFYGGSLFTQFAMQGDMDEFTVRYLRHALFEEGEFELKASETFTDVDLSWDDPAQLENYRPHEPSKGWFWDGSADGTGQLWGGCLESVDEMLRHNTPIPSLEQFENIVLMLETSEEVPSQDYVARVIRAFGERGMLERIKAVLVGRPKACSPSYSQTSALKAEYRAAQRDTVLRVVRNYNSSIPVVQNLDFGHTDPQIPMPYGGLVKLNSALNTITAQF